MAVEPGVYNFSIQRRADHPLPLEFEESEGVALNLTGWTVYAQVWNKDRTTKYADFSVTYIDRVLGKIQLFLSELQTALLPDECFYDVKLENPGGIAEYYLEGIIYVSEGYTL
jgi:hypothetical protein